MKLLKRRTAITLLLAAALAAGVLLFCVRLFRDGADWVGFYATSFYESGAIYDSNEVLLYNGKTGDYAADSTVRRSTLHLVGNRSFGTSLRSVLSGRLTGYNPITGTALGGHDVTLTLDASLNAAALNALNGRKGVVAIYDYTTGAVKCMVSSPTFDPLSPPSDVDTNPAYEGVYLNRFFSGTYPPGSVFKLVTTAAALEKMGDMSSFSYTCTGSLNIGEDVVTCPYVHGANMNFEQCLACSCNGAYATLALQLGGETLEDYMRQAGLLDSVNVNGIDTAKGSFEKQPAGSNYLGWSGVGQDKDLVNPCTMLSFMGGIANRGVAVVPNLVAKETISGSPILAALPVIKDTYKIFTPSTCETLKAMMRNNVLTQYGQEQFGDLAVCAKSGTAEVGNGNQPHAWFAGFIDDEDHPLAFVVLVENGGSGANVAGAVAAQLLKAAAAE